MLVTRYLFKNLAAATIFIALTLTLVIWLTQSLKLLELVTNSDAPPALFIKLVALTLPKFLEVILPLSLVMAILFVYNKMIMDNEIIVMRACGVNQYALAKPAVLLAAGVSLFLLLVSLWLSPMSYSGVQQLRQTIKTQYSAFLLRDGVFNTFGNSLTIYLRARSEAGEMLGLMIHDAREKDKPPVTIIAKKGRIEMDGETPNIVVFDGMRQQLDVPSGTISKLYFSRYTIEIKGLEGTTEDHWRNAEERSLEELFNPDLANRRDRQNAGLFRAEAHSRLISPWNALSFTFAALAVILIGPFNRRGQGLKIVAAGVVVVALQVLSLTVISVAKRHAGAVPFIYLSTLAPILIGAWALHLRGEQAIMRLLRRWNARPLAGEGAAA